MRAFYVKLACLRKATTEAHVLFVGSACGKSGCFLQIVRNVHVEGGEHQEEVRDRILRGVNSLGLDPIREQLVVLRDAELLEVVRKAGRRVVTLCHVSCRNRGVRRIRRADPPRHRRQEREANEGDEEDEQLDEGQPQCQGPVEASLRARVLELDDLLRDLPPDERERESAGCLQIARGFLVRDPQGNPCGYDDDEEQEGHRDEPTHVGKKALPPVATVLGLVLRDAHLEVRRCVHAPPHLVHVNIVIKVRHEPHAPDGDGEAADSQGRVLPTYCHPQRIEAAQEDDHDGNERRKPRSPDQGAEKAEEGRHLLAEIRPDRIKVRPLREERRRRLRQRPAEDLVR
mmetsp:Transcript_100741/g.282323  ORF Transcript_100741/g.282323 Transcript_100741/m.282323 type:complete len:344 (-) Transcript_100741:463-1494(-)